MSMKTTLSALAGVWTLMFTLGSSTAHALDSCTDREVIRRVCQPSPGPRDDSGVGKTIGEIGALKERFRLSARQVSPEAYLRLERIAGDVISAYEEVVDGFPAEDRLWHRIRLGGFKLPSREELSVSGISAALVGPDGTYSFFKDTIELTPIILNDPEISETELATVIAHEMGHFLDPEAFTYTQIPFRKNARLSDLSQELNACFEKNFVPKYFRRSATFEQYADWMAAQAMRLYVRRESDPETRRARAINTAYFFCNKGTSKIWGPVDKFDFYVGLDAHPFGNMRIIAFMNNPDSLGAIGCAPELVGSDGAPVPRCDFKDPG